MNYTLATDICEEIKEFDTIVLKGFPWAWVSIDAVVLRVYRDGPADKVKSIFVKVLNEGTNVLPIPFVKSHFKSWKRLGAADHEGLFLKNINFSNRPSDLTLIVSKVIRCAKDTTYTETHSIYTTGTDGSHNSKNRVNTYRIVRFMERERSSSYYSQRNTFSSTGTCYITSSGYYGYASDWDFKVAARKARDEARKNESRLGGRQS